MRSLTTATVIACLLSSSVAFAAGPTKSKSNVAKGKKPAAETVASAAPLPQLPAASPQVAVAPAAEPTAASTASAAAPPAKDAASTAAGVERESAGTGFVLVVGSGGGYLGGKIADAIDVSAGLVTFDLKLGGYVTPHFGIMGGVQGGFGALFEGCAGTCSKAFHYQLPIVAQYAFTDRSRGAYLEGGLALISTYGASTDSQANPDASPESLTVSVPVDLKVGVGYRIPVGLPTQKAATSALDLRLGADFGEFEKLEYRTVAGSVVGDIANEKRATHFALGLSVGYHFAP